MEGESAYSEVRLMALTHAEFLRSLPRAVEGFDCRIEGRRILLADPPRLVEIRLGKEQTRTLGSLVLPQTRVELIFTGFADRKMRDFLVRFDLAFQRGGG